LLQTISTRISTSVFTSDGTGSVFLTCSVAIIPFIRVVNDYTQLNKVRERYLAKFTHHAKDSATTEQRTAEPNKVNIE